jgi:hypothetical protein
MKKYVLIAGLGLITAGGVTAAVLNNGNKKTTTKHTSKSCPYHQCSKSSKLACY